MKRYIHPDQLKEVEIPKPQPPEIPISDITFGDLLDRSRLILHREIYNLTYESSKGKLSRDSAQSLRDYVKLLNDLSEQEKGLVTQMSEDELKAASGESK